MGTMESSRTARTEMEILKLYKEEQKMVKIDDMQSVEEFLNDVQTFFKEFDNVNKKLINELTNKEAEKNDLLHEIELSKLNAIERMAIYSKLKTVLHERRIIKNKLELLNTLKEYSNKFIEKGICGETNTTIKNIKNLQMTQAERGYTPRVLKDLKCAKHKKSETNTNVS